MAIPSKLYRFIPLYELMDICEKPGKLVLKSPRLWDDSYEGYFYKKLMDEESLKIMFERFIELIEDDDLDLEAVGEKASFTMNITNAKQKAILSMLRFSAMYFLIFCISWSKLEESDALWRIYNYDNMALRISTKPKTFKNIEGIFFSEVRYQSEFNFSKILYDVLYRDAKRKHINMKLFKPFCIKRIQFNHEKEVRLFYLHGLPSAPMLNLIMSENHKDEDLNYVIKNIKNCFDNDDHFISKEYKKILNRYLVPFLEEKTTIIELKQINLKPKDLIDDVMVHPLAPDFYVDIVQNYCKRYELKFLGKSKLYKFE